jgi:hypothetical protein
MKETLKPALDFLKWDLRTILAVILALAILIGFSLAQTALFTFDFGTASTNELASGAVHVKGAITTYPTSNNDLTYGWQSSNVQEFSNSNVSDLLNRDYNGSSGANSFKILGLEPSVYDVKFVVGDPDSTLATRIQLGNQAVDVVANRQIRSVILTHEVVGNDLTVGFSSADGATNWGINAISLTPVSGSVPIPSFHMSLTPVEQTIKAGGVAIFVVGLTPIDNYASNIDLTINGLVAGMSAEFVPSTVKANSSSELRIRTEVATSPNLYEFLIVAKGQDDANVVQNGVVTLNVQSSGVIVIPPLTGGDVVTPPSTGGDVDVVIPPVVDRSHEEVKEDFTKIDEFVQEYQDKVIAERKDIKFIEGISAELYGVPILPELPKPKTPLENLLQNFVQAGLIQSTVDTAPPAALDVTLNKASFWDRFLRSLAPSAY